MRDQRWRAKDIMHSTPKDRSIKNRNIASHPRPSADRRPSAPRSAVLTRRELRQIVAEMLG